jgi:hypothetical protein
VLKKTVLSLVLLFILFQFVPVQRTNPSVEADLQVNPPIRAELKKACFDCHSYETIWPWYSRIAPVSWLIANDVKKGREHLNFSSWELMSAEDKNVVFHLIREEVESGGMPLKPYTLLHRNAVLTNADKQMIYAWLDAATEENSRAAIPIETSNAQH